MPDAILHGIDWAPPSAEDAERSRTLAHEAGVTLPLSRVLLSRGLTDADAVRAFLHPRLDELHAPLELRGMDRAVARVRDALRVGEPVWIFGDYDVDGTVGTAILADLFRVLGKPATPYLPRREEGYGLSVEAIRRLADRGARVVITVDNGIGAHDVAREARARGVDLIVTDHHEPKGGIPEAACAVIDPKQPGCGYPNKGLCGAGLALKLAWGIVQELSPGARASPPLREFLLEATGMAALATVADVVPLRGENRALVRHGLAVLQRSPRPGFAAMREVCRPPRAGGLTARDLAYEWAPRINAAGRLEGPELALELLTTRDATRARELARHLDALNRKRQEMQSKTLQEALAAARAQEGLGCVVVSGETWHAGIVGIVAGRLAREFGVPAVAIAWGADGTGTGSARSPDGWSLVAALQACDSLLERHGGHARAAGMTLRRDREGAFREAFAAAVRAQSTSPAPPPAPDAGASPAELEGRLALEMRRMEPFGEGNPRPLLEVPGARVAGRPRCFGGGGAHLEFYLCGTPGGVRAVSFGAGGLLDAVTREAGPYDLLAHVGTPWRGGDAGALELEVVAIRKARVS